MGSSDDVHVAHPSERPAHTVRLTHAFHILGTEVTRAQWKDVMGTTPWPSDGCGMRCPVTNITWFDAVHFVNTLSELESRPVCYTVSQCSDSNGHITSCQDVQFVGLQCAGYRLPTEAEWEHAARAVDTSALSLKSLEGHAPPSDTIGPVQQHPPTTWGLHDILGGVGEWTHDRYSAQFYVNSPKTDPIGPERGEQRTWRDCTYADSPVQCRFAVRRFATAGNTSTLVGLRPAITKQ